MVNFSVFNELSLPLHDLNEFENFFKVLENLKRHGLSKIRTDMPFSHYPEILPMKTFQQLLGQIRDRDKKRRLLSFINSTILTIESPLIKDEEIEDNEEAIENSYYYNKELTFGGLACCDIWDTIAVSFNSSNQWNKDTIVIQRNDKDINIRHLSNVEHMEVHNSFFELLEDERKSEITQDNFWENREISFSKKIIFAKEVEKQIKVMDTSIFRQAIGLLRDIETGRKVLDDYNHSGESQSVKDDENLTRHRYFTVKNKKIFFENHIKSLPSGNRIYFLEQDGKIYIGYIGKHLPTKKFK